MKKAGIFIRYAIAWVLIIFSALMLLGCLAFDSVGEDEMVPVLLVLLAVGIGMLFYTRYRKKKATQKAILHDAQLKSQRIAEVSAVTELPVVQDSMAAIILKPGEICHYQAPANTIVIKNQVVGYKGGSSGVSVRVAKGVTLRSGSSRGTPIREDVVTRYPGVFTMTGQRFVMTGEKGFDRQIEKLTAMSPWNGYEGIMLQFGSSSYIIEMDEPYWVPKILDLLNESKAK